MYSSTRDRFVLLKPPTLRYLSPLLPRPLRLRWAKACSVQPSASISKRLSGRATSRDILARLCSSLAMPEVDHGVGCDIIVETSAINELCM